MAVRPPAWRRVATATATATALAAAMTMLTACGREASSASEAVSQFYTVLDAAGISRVPDGPQWQALRPYLADSLARALERARVAREQAERASPGEKPPFADGDVFSSLFEGRTGVVVTDSLPRAGDTTLVVARFTNDTQKPAVTWTDTVVVVRDATRYVVADIRYGTAWEFGFRGRLLDLLTATP